MADDDDLDDDLANDLDSALSATEVLGIKIPLTYKEAINDLEHGEQWREAIIEELVASGLLREFGVQLDLKGSSS